MLTPIDHPVFGLLVPDQWKSDLLAFRQFPYMMLFWRPDAEYALRCLDPKVRAWVKNWETHGAELAPICRDGDVHYALRSLGVFEVNVVVGKDGHVSGAQAATYQMFLDQEALICRNVQNALLRYFHYTRKVAPGWFTGAEYAAATTIEELAPYVRFDSISICSETSHRLCPITFGWEPDWDMEHKLGMLLYRDQVLEIGPAASGCMLLLEPEEYLTAPDMLWGPDQLNDAEQKTLQEFVAGYNPESEEEDIQF